MNRFSQIISGLQGLISGGVATVDLPPNRRYHDLRWFLMDGTTPVLISDFLNYMRLSVNGVVMRDLLPAHLSAIAAANAITLDTGEVVNWFTEPWRKGLLGDEATSWDMVGQIKFTAEFGIKSTIATPNIVGLQTFDYNRNSRPASRGSSQKVNFLAPIKQLNFSYSLAAGQNDITTLPIQFPIQGFYLFPATPSSIQHIEIYADGVKVLEGDLLSSYGPQDVLSIYRDYGVVVSPTQVYIPIFFDYDDKLSNNLLVGKELVLRVWSSVPQGLNILVENRPSSYV